MIGAAIILSPGKEAGKDIWIAILFAGLLGLPMIFVHTRLLRIFPGDDLFDIQQKAFGKVIGKVISCFYIWFAFHLGSLVLRNFSEFIQVVSLQETPQFPVLIIMVILCIWAVKSGIEVLGRWAAFFLPLFLFIVIGLTFLSIPDMDLDNIRPVLYDGISPVLNGTASLFAFPFAEPVLFTMVFNSLKAKDKTLKAYIISMLITGGVLITVSVRNILVLGLQNFTIIFFPSYSSASIITIGDYFGRIEALSGTIFFFAEFVKASVSLYIASKGFAKILNFSHYNQLAAPIGLLMVCMATFVYSSTMEMFDWASEIYKYYVLPFYVIIPLITLIVIEIKVRRNKSSNKQ